MCIWAQNTLPALPVAQNDSGNATVNVSGEKSQCAKCIKFTLFYHIKCFIDKKMHKK